MRVSYNWLGEYVDLDLSPSETAKRLTMVGLEVEELYPRYAYLDRVVAARVVKAADHPQASHLKVCQVETDRDSYQVVCGAPNTRPGQISALALPGTVLPSGATVGETDIRGYTSTGMLCSEAELVVGLNASGIIELDPATRPGQKLADVLGLEDWIMEIGITPNRPDCLCMLGVAREAAGLLGRPVKYPTWHIEAGPDRIEDLTSIQILDPEHCPRYVARVILGVKIKPSPFWLVDRLAAGGVRAINNIVDITNFVLLEYGQPLHAFDMDRLAERRIVVKLAEEGERFVTLDETERYMSPETLMICDGEKSVAVGGVMGGLNSEIEDATENVLLESAYFNPISIRRTAKALGLSTEASYRFERGIDPGGCLMAADRAAALMAQLGGGVVVSGFIDANPIRHKNSVIDFSPARCNRFLGTDFAARDMVQRLEGIELKVSGQGENLKVEVPSFRVDLTREADLFEEAARLVGFDQVPATMPAVQAERQPEAPARALTARIREILKSLGLFEIISYSFIADGFPDLLGLPGDDPRRRTVRIVNPLSEDQALMRTTMVPGLLEAWRHNQAYGVTDVRIYEVGAVFLAVEGKELPEERPVLGGLLTGGREQLAWFAKPEPVDFFEAKGVVEDLLEALHLPEPVFERVEPPAYYDQAATAGISMGGLELGWVGRVTEKAAKAFNLRLTGGETAYIFELDLQTMLALDQGPPSFRPLPRFPLVSRDLALIVDRDLPAADLIRLIRSLKEEFLEQIFVFDAYEGRRLEPGQKSLAFRLLYRSLERTLTDEEVNEIHERIMDQVMAAFEARLQAR